MITEFNKTYWKEKFIEICEKLDSDFSKFPNEDRDALSSTILKRLRDLVNAVSTYFYLEKNKDKFFPTQYEYIQAGISFIKENSKFNWLRAFYKRLEVSVSHYSPLGEQAERLMLSYLDCLFHLKDFLYRELDLVVLVNLTKYPMDLDATFETYYEKIISVMDSVDFKKTSTREKETYYVQKKKTIYCKGRLFYEYTLSSANDSSSKFDRFTAISTINVFKNYAIKASFIKVNISLFGKDIPISFLTDYEVGIRPCEFEKLYEIININARFSKGKEYSKLMSLIESTEKTLDEMIDISDSDFNRLLASISTQTDTSLKRFLIVSRKILLGKLPGRNVYKYLLHTINNQIIKNQKPSPRSSYVISNSVKITSKDRLFDLMPFAFSPIKHNPKYETLVECFGTSEHKDELLKRFISEKSNEDSILYNPLANNANSVEIDKAISNFNALCRENKLNSSFELERFGQYVFEKGAEAKTHEIVGNLLSMSKTINFPYYEEYAASRVKNLSLPLDDKLKEDALRTMFKNGSLFVVYGSAGTGKTTFANFAMQVLGDNTQAICVANTNPALENLKSKLKDVVHADYYTAYKCKTAFDTVCQKYDILVIDECSTISNDDMIGILRKIKPKLILLLGDIHQIEAIRFGNWFSVLYHLLPQYAKTELNTEFRAESNHHLHTLWKAVRENKSVITDYLNKYEISRKLSDSIFNRGSQDEIVLCLNYDGLYGINNINNYLQAANPNVIVNWKQYSFKKDDPILFFETKRFRTTLYNNLKGKIEEVYIDSDGNIHFEIIVNCTLNPLTDCAGGLKVIQNYNDGKTKISFMVRKAQSKDYENDMPNDCQIPFQIAYAISIHKAQGLEYESVKVVITNEVDELITHNIFYTAITRAKNTLAIYWSPESEREVINNLRVKSVITDCNILRNRFSDLHM